MEPIPKRLPVTDSGLEIRGRLVIERIATIASTNTELLERAVLFPPGVPVDSAAVWLVAASQTAGRGRRGRRWLGSPGVSLTASLGLDIALPSDPGALALVAGLAVAETLAGLGVAVRLKWPNDVYLRAGDGSLTKVGGILCETRRLINGPPASAPDTDGGGLNSGHYQRERASTSTAPWRLVIGCGLNLFPSDDSASLALTNPPAGYLFEQPDAQTRARLELALGAALLEAVRQATEVGPGPALARWQKFDLLAGCEVTVHTPSGSYQALAEGVDQHGRLLVADAALPQTRRALLSEEVTVRWSRTTRD